MKKQFIVLTLLSLGFSISQGRATMVMERERDSLTVSVSSLQAFISPATLQAAAEEAYKTAHQLRHTHETEAFKAMHIAATFNLPKAQCDLGAMLENGIGCQSNPKNAFHYYQLAAQQEYPSAENALGRVYELGIGTPQDTDAALTWYGKAVEHGHELATDNLERLLRETDEKKC